MVSSSSALRGRLRFGRALFTACSSLALLAVLDRPAFAQTVIGGINSTASLNAAIVQVDDLWRDAKATGCPPARA
ncbi:MAG: hypothetical protein JO172_15185 [Hyphomicrobiales bacterium]|nr:hypothetical protein [Hyphomicrobiales bacterium]